jgi:hypothetical protein
MRYNQKLNREYGQFIGSMDWDIHITIHYLKGCKSSGGRKNIQNIYNKNRNLIQRLFFISERNSDYKNIHNHLLIKLSSPTERIKLNKYSSITNIDERLIPELLRGENCENVSQYVCKFIDRNVDWDILL